MEKDLEREKKKDINLKSVRDRERDLETHR